MVASAADVSASSICIGILGGGLVITWACMDYGGEQVIASVGRAIVRLVTLGRVRLRDTDDSTAIGIGALVVIICFFGLLLSFAFIR